MPENHEKRRQIFNDTYDRLIRISLFYFRKMRLTIQDFFFFLNCTNRTLPVELIALATWIGHHYAKVCKLCGGNVHLHDEKSKYRNLGQLLGQVTSSLGHEWI